jgi:NADH-quinone oxidoreductase subunit C
MSDEALNELGDYIASALPDEVIAARVERGELTVTIQPAAVAKVMMRLRDDANCAFKMLIDITGVDWPDRDPRFDVVYHLLSLSQNQRVRVKLAVNEDQPVPSIVEVFPAADWFERETWDMYGVFFSDHPDLRRLLTDYGFEGHPLRKDFPLTGYVEVRYDEEQKRVVYEPVELVQDFRSFDFMSPWEGADYILPGDEKAASEQAKDK